MKLFFTVTKKGLLVALAVAVTFFLCIMWVTSLKVSAINGDTHRNRMTYIKSLNIDVDENSVSVKETVIPEDFGEVYERYNEVQKKAGFDLTPFKGREVTVYSYPLKNQNRVLTLIVCEDRIIGGDISDIKIDGEMKPLKENKDV